MAVVNATLCLPFRQAEETVAVWKQTVREACKRTCFPFVEEAEGVLGDIEDILIPLLYVKLIARISVDFGQAGVDFTLAYDAAPEDEDEVDIDVLDLVLEPPGTCVITLTLRDPDRADFLNCLDLESFSSTHVSVVIAPVGKEEEEGE